MGFKLMSKGFSGSGRTLRVAGVGLNKVKGVWVALKGVCLCLEGIRYDDDDGVYVKTVDVRSY